MVGLASAGTAWPYLIAAENGARPAIEKLDPNARVAIIMALLGIVVLGVALVTFILLVGSWTRRQGGPGRPAGKRGLPTSSYIHSSTRSIEEDDIALPPTSDDEARDADDPAGRDTTGGDSFGWKETVTDD